MKTLFAVAVMMCAGCKQKPIELCSHFRESSGIKECRRFDSLLEALKWKEQQEPNHPTFPNL